MFVGKWQPSYTKSLGLSSLLKDRNALLIFSPEHSLSPPNGNLSYVIRSVALQYHSCSNESSTGIDSILKHMEEDYRTKVEFYHKLVDECSSFRKKFLRSKCCSCTLSGTDICILGLDPCYFINDALNSSLLSTYAHSVTYRIKNLERTSCLMHKYRKIYRWTSNERDFPNVLNLRSQRFQFYDWGCSNKSLNIRILNLEKSWPLAKRFGIQEKHTKRGNAVIIDKNRELISTMDKPINFESLSRFITDYHRNSLQEYESSYDVKMPPCNPKAPACIIPLNSSNFLSFINQEKDTVVYFSSPNCASCSTFNHIFLELARYFNHTKLLSFGKVNAKDVPIRFKPTRIPSLILFPAYDKDDSSVIEAKKSIEELVAWVVENINARLVLSDEFNCNKECVEYNLNRTDYWITTIYKQVERIEKRENILNQKESLREVEKFYLKYLQLSKIYKKEQLINIYKINNLLSSSTIGKDTLSHVLKESKMKSIFYELKNLNLNSEIQGAG